MQLVRGRENPRRAGKSQRPSQAPRGEQRTGRKTAAETSNAASRPEVARDPLENSIPFLLRRTSRYFRLALQNRLRQYGLGFSHWFYLRALWLGDGITQRELCKRIEAVEPAAVTALAGLERGGYIRRVRNKENRREVKIFTTAKGKALSSELLPFAAQISAVGVEGIPEHELAIVRSVLNRIRSNMSNARLGEP